MPLTQQQIEEYAETGFLVVKNALTKAEIRATVQSLENEIEQRSQTLFEENKILNLCRRKPFKNRYAHLYTQCREISEDFSIEQIRREPLFNLLNSQNILDIIEPLIGTNITLSPSHNLRAKLPFGLVPPEEDEDVVPWHQDALLNVNSSDPSDLITVWVPLVEATVDNGCLEVVPHTSNIGHLKHDSDDRCAIREENLPQTKRKALTCTERSIVLMHKYLPHRSTPNFSRGIRWSIDIRYQKSGTPTGRENYPEFVVRGENTQSSPLSYEHWCSQWSSALR